ncbi:hypothetical protein BLKGLAD_70460 (plasmid) [Burkholderia gladioli pv. gladioli]
MESTGSSQIEDGGVADFANRWGHNFWRLVYRMAYRLIVMKYWVLGVLVFGIAMFVDAAVRRKVTAAAAGFVSPLWFQLAAHGILPVFGTTFTFLIAPVFDYRAIFTCRRCVPRLAAVESGVLVPMTAES